MLIAAASWKAPRTHHVFSRVPSPRPACLMQLNEVVASSNLVCDRDSCFLLASQILVGLTQRHHGYLRCVKWETTLHQNEAGAKTSRMSQCVISRSHLG